MVTWENPNYWDKDSIKLDTVRILQVNDPNTAIAMYESDELDFTDIPTPLLEEYKKKMVKLKCI